VLQGRGAIVTDAGAGMGRWIALTLTERGSDAVVADIE
jgi:NAD(P)-dependent dehydrogenase (short-subunit alcohol dehydrogenase family)